MLTAGMRAEYARSRERESRRVLDNKQDFGTLKAQLIRDLREYINNPWVFFGHKQRADSFLLDINAIKITGKLTEKAAIETLLGFMNTARNVFIDPSRYANPDSDKLYERAPKNGPDKFNQILEYYAPIFNALRKRLTLVDNVSVTIPAVTVPALVFASLQKQFEKEIKINVPTVPLVEAPLTAPLQVGVLYQTVSMDSIRAKITNDNMRVPLLKSALRNYSTFSPPALVSPAEPRLVAVDANFERLPSPLELSQPETIRSSSPR